MTTVQATFPGTPMLLDVVNRVLRETGCYTVASLNPGNTQSQVALDAINDGLWHIYQRAHWTFANATVYIQLVANQSDYSLPADFDRMSQTPVYNSLPLREYTLDEWTRAIPQNAPSQTTQAGSPTCFTVSGAVLSLYPAVSTAAIAVCPSLQFSYYKNPGTRFDNTNDAVAPNLPASFVDCLVTFGKWRLKSFLEYPDASSEAQRFEQLLQTQLNRNNPGRKPNQMRPMYGPAMLTTGTWDWN